MSKEIHVNVFGMYFITQKEVEALLETETRPLPMPDGTTEYFRGFKLMWQGVDELKSKHDVSLEFIVEMALLDTDKGRPFYRIFPNSVAYILQKYEEEFG